MSKHTATPWEVEPHHGLAYGMFDIVRNEPNGDYETIATTTQQEDFKSSKAIALAKANAAYIVTSVNEYESLKLALEASQGSCVDLVRKNAELSEILQQIVESIEVEGDSYWWEDKAKSVLRKAGAV